MRILIITDLEGVAGIVDKDNWTQLHSKYYQKATRLLTNETNSAIQGFLDGGADEVIVIDGHGPGAVDIELLHEKAIYARMVPTHKICENIKIDALAWVGQHAKAGTERAHMAHSGNFTVIDYSLNGHSVGEFGRSAAGAGNYDVPPIFGSGDKAFTLEAKELCPKIETVSVKECFETGRGDDMTYEQYYKKNIAAIHLSPAESCKRIYKGALNALTRFTEKPTDFNIVDIKPPYTQIQKIRPTGGVRGHNIIKRADTFDGLLTAQEEWVDWE